MVMPRGRETPTDLEQLRRWSHWLDAAFRIPGTGIRVGWDPILGLFPGLGDVIPQVFSVAIVLQAFRLGLPKVVQARIVLNILLDVLVGTIPIVGDVFDVAWKANLRNVRLIERYGAASMPRRAVRPADWAFVLAAMLIVIVCALAPIVVLVWLVQRFGVV